MLKVHNSVRVENRAPEVPIYIGFWWLVRVSSRPQIVKKLQEIGAFFMPYNEVI
jgi:hypothetical protein